MPELFLGKIPIIRRDLNEGFMRGMPAEPLATGAIPRDFDVDPVEMRDSPDQMELVDPSEYDARYDEQMEKGTHLLHIYLPGDMTKPAFEFLDQNGFPDCWFHSTCHAVMMLRAILGLPPIRFNAVAGATLLNQTNGGWCGLSMKFGREHGLPVVGTGPGEWPYKSRRGQDTPELRASMARHKVTEDWYDLGRKEWDQKLARKQLFTCSFNNHPGAADYNDYGHSMGQFGMVRIERNAWGRLTLNSWQGFGYFGLCVIPETTSNVDNAVAVRATTSSVK